jgi:4-hydroxy-tetrahydrodipicolinate synthase
MSCLGLCAADVRLPLVPLTDKTKALVEDGLRHAGLLG